MKKLMILLGVVACAVGVQAATVTWSSGAIFKPVDAEGTKGTGAANLLKSNANVQWYVFAGLTAEQYADAQDAGTVYGWLTAKDAPTKTAPASQGTQANGTLLNISTGDYSANQNVLAAIVVTYKDGNGDTWYIENYASVTISGAGSDSSVANLANKIGGTGAAISEWTAVVPEPTSGLLLLIGMAGLALRRRRA